MKNNFQTVLIAIFLAFFVFAVFIFSGILPIGQKSTNSETNIVGNVVVWGTFDSGSLQEIFETIGFENKDLNITYVQKDKDTYQNDLLTGFAKGEGPDLFMLSNDTLLQNKSFLYQIPYASYSKRIFQDSFINGASIFLDDAGIDALPIVSDPLVLFYNKSLLSNAGISSPPKYWDELFDLNSKLTKTRADGAIVQSMIALGAYENITNAKDIISLLFLQSGNNIVSRSGENIYVDFDTGSGLTSSLNNELVNFYVEFSKPLGSTYSWNKGIIPSKDLFTGNSLAFYIGHASELFDIEEVNPNLSFDVTEIPQIRNEVNKTTNGDIYAVAVSKSSQNISGAFGVAYSLSSSKYVDLFAKALSLPPALKESLQENPDDPYLFSFYKTAISLRTWLDPNEKITDEIFGRFIENIISGRTSVDDATGRLQSEMNLILN